MSIRAGSIIHVGGRNVIDRLQSAGLGDARIPIETVREVGNDLVVEKIPGEADFTFGLESWDVSSELMAWLTGKVGGAVRDEQQRVTVRNATGGTFTLTFGADTTAGIAYNATAAAVTTALEALPSIGAGNVVVTGDAGGPYTVRFQGTLAGANQAMLTGSDAALTPGIASLSIDLLYEGGSTTEPGEGDAVGTAYKWEDCKFVHITSPWKRNPGTSGGNISAGVVVPTYYPTRLRYRFGVTDNAVQEVELSGGAYYYAETAPVEEFASGDGATVAFITAESARAHRIGGAAGTTFRRVLGVLVDGQLQVEGVDYEQSIGAADTGQAAVTTITFEIAPANGASVAFVYFTESAKAYPQSVHASTIIKPGAVRGRNIEVMLGTRGVNQARLPGLQSFELEATVEGEVEREMGNTEITGRSVTGTDTTGTANFRPKDIAAFFAALEQVTGVPRDEVFGYLNQNSVPVEVLIRNPRNPAEVIKTIYVEDGLFQPPGTPARVNTATEFSMRFDSQRGSFAEFKGYPSTAQLEALY